MPPTRTREYIESRFEPQPNGCWLWTGATSGHRNGKGRYGHLVFQGRRVPSHRLMWEFHNGPVPDGLFVLHSCDDGLCGNPAHLFLGTHQDNMDDMVRKGRGPDVRGVRNPNRKLTPKQVAEIRAAEGSQDTIATAYGITQSMVSKIKLRQNWKG